ncbi:mitochondrial arginine transporter BAC1 isoform X2 [Macadamia integrifolia]|uniref:mitochondrial arginine transporter BAC1 isoform X2 n=1 Tax=Macadamia integrifolia TaxID=60698 RepID=UPI001C52745E|nr:mitochondrial arginine transporter BAC1 isoform X2 [Macadamia integrifolia]
MAEASAYKEYLAGLAAGIATVVVGHPFDTVKVKLQKHNTEAHGIKYRNALHCTSRILKNEGVKGLYRGATSSFVGMAVEGSLFFGIYSQTKQSLQGEVRSSRPQIQCRMQVQGTDSLVLKHDRYSSPLDCAVKTIKTEGVKGIFRGGFATLLRESIGNSAFFCTYEYSRYYLRSQLNSISSEHIALPTAFSDIGIGIISGGLGGAAFWSTVLPLDVAKTVIQTSPDASRNPFQILSSIYRIAGFRGCYAGLNPTLARAFPANAAAIVAWEFSAKMLGIKRD